MHGRCAGPRCLVRASQQLAAGKGHELVGRAERVLHSSVAGEGLGLVGGVQRLGSKSGAELVLGLGQNFVLKTVFKSCPRWFKVQRCRE